MEKYIFTKVDTVLIYQITDTKLISIEDDYQIYKLLKNNLNTDLAVMFHIIDKKELVEFDITHCMKKVFLKNKTSNYDIIDFSFYVHDLLKFNKKMAESVNNFEKIEKIYNDFIIHLKKFRQDQILKYTFHVNQRRISRKQLMQMKEEIKEFAKVNWTFEDVF